MGRSLAAPLWVFIATLGCIALPTPTINCARGADAIDFNRQIQPILAKHCYQCHGPNEDKGGLRLSNREAATAELDSGAHAIVPGKIDQSELLRRVKSEDEGERMPPEGKPLSSEQIAVLEAWIASGAEWKTHWSLEPIKRPEIPVVKDQDWVRQPLDAFVLQRIEAAGLQPAAPADKTALLRRATYDLTGLPPTCEELAAFLKDESSDAFERVVDRLLASPHYGERWGRHWLDVIRYAETNSFERDGAKPHVYRFRDYVIRAFNDDKPFDQFIREQIAGDELEKPTNDSIVATGYYRLGVWDDEPADRLQARYDELDDLVATTSQAFLGLTVNCARCHDHKIDPISQRDYYQLVAFFQNLRPMANDGLNIEMPIFEDPGAEEDYRAGLAAIQREKNNIQDGISQIEKVVAARYADSGQAAAIKSLDNVRFRFYRDTWATLPDFANLKPETVGTIPEGYFDIALASRESAFGFVFDAELIVPETGDYTFYLDSDDGSRLIVNERVLLTYDGIHAIEKEQQVTARLAKGRWPISLQYFQRDGGLGLQLAWSGGPLGSDRVPLAKSQTPAPKIAVGDLMLHDQAALASTDETARYKYLRAELDKVNARKPPSPQALCVTENGRDCPETHILSRGNPHVPADLVQPGFPKVLSPKLPTIPTPGPNAKSSGRRSVLAQWMTAPDNKLTSRVIANRLWQHHFGRGIVRSSNNFGGLGTPPTHPELLDYLATELVANGWRLKAAHRAIMLSSTYRMASHASAEAQAKDPANDLFSHFDMRRLGAEEIRDSMLALHGGLNLTLFGPSVFPEIAPEVMAGQSVPGKGWGTSNAKEVNRRSVYIHVKRSLIVPILSNFDFPETDSSCEARFATTQPTQALSMINGKFVHEQAAALSARLARQAGAQPRERVRLALQLALCREPEETRIERGVQLVASLKNDYALKEEQAWRYFCLTVLNLNEFVYLD